MARKIIDQIVGKSGIARNLSQARHYDHRAQARAQGPVNLGIEHEVPERVFEGMLVLADGSNWAPTTDGPGFYLFMGGRWHKIGPPPIDSVFDFGRRRVEGGTLDSIDFGTWSSHPSTSYDMGEYT